MGGDSYSPERLAKVVSGSVSGLHSLWMYCGSD